MAGIVLVGGSGFRRNPMSRETFLQLLSVFINADILDIQIISTPEELSRFESLLGDGHQYGLSIFRTVSHLF